MVRARVEAPVFRTMTSLPALMDPTARAANARLAGESVIGELEAPVPVPVRETSSGVSVALSAKATAPSTAPTAVGLNVMSSVQDAPAASVAPQPCTAAGVAAKPPLVVTLAMVILAAVWFVRL
jgi:hypothetical protein